MFLAKEVVFALERYAASLKPPFFGVLMDYDYQGNQMWTCPGHQGGSFTGAAPPGDYSSSTWATRCSVMTSTTRCRNWATC